MSDPGGRGRSMRLLIEPMHNSLTAIVSAHAPSASQCRRKTIASVTATRIGQSIAVPNSLLNTFAKSTSGGHWLSIISRYHQSSTRCTTVRAEGAAIVAVSSTPRPRRTRPVSITRRRSAGNESGTGVPVTVCRAWVTAPTADSTRSLPALRSSNKGTGGGNLRARPHPHADDEQHDADECRDDTGDEDAYTDREQMRDGQPEASVRADTCRSVGVHDDQAVAAVADLP